MSCDLNLRGVKRKLSVDEIDTGGVVCPSLSTENEPIRQRLSSSPPPLNSSLAEIKSLVGNVSSSLCNGNFKSIAVSPSSLSSESMSDEDDEDDEDDDDESGHVDDESYMNQTLDDSYGIASAESESGYDERASSNSSSLSDAISTTSDYEFSPIVASSELSTVSSSASSSSTKTASSSIFSSQVDTSSSCSSSPSTCVSNFPPKSVPSSIECNSSGERTNGSSFCAYSMAPLSSNKVSPHYAQRPQSQSYSHINAANQRNKMNYLRQRQQIFNLSMCKLSRFRQSSDPSLHRSVLICNTLRMLEKELEREGLKINFGPNGVSFISPVSTPDLDFLPMLQTPPLPSMSPDCPSASDGSPGPFTGLPSSDSSEHASYHHHYQTPCDSSTDGSCPEYDKYLQLENSSPSGRATPFVKTFMSNEPYSNRLHESSMNSALWGNFDEQMSDRLTSLNWSSMLSFNSSNSSPSTPTSPIAEATARHSNQSSPPEVLSNGSMMPYSNEQSPAMSTNNGNSAFSSSCASLSSNSSSATFATLLPPVSTSSMPSMDLPSSVTSAHTVQTDSYHFSSNTSSSTYYSTSSPMYTPQSQPSSANFGATGPVSNTTVSNGPSATYMSTSYMNSYLNYPTSDEIFGDIDLSLYDFDIFSPLSPPNVANKPAPIMSAEELIRNINSSECNNMSSATTTSTTCSSPSLISINHYTVNGFSGQSFTSSSYSTSTTPTAVVSSSITSSSPSINGQLLLQQSVSTPSTVQANCGSVSSGTGIHLHTASSRYYKTPESEREQITTIKCHN